MTTAIVDHEVKQILDDAVREAQDAGDRTLGGQHVLLAMCGTDNSGWLALRWAGAAPRPLMAAAVRASSNRPPHKERVPLSGELRRALDDGSRAVGQPLSAAALLASLMRNQETGSVRTIVEAGLDPQDVLDAIVALARIGEVDTVAGQMATIGRTAESVSSRPPPAHDDAIWQSGDHREKRGHRKTQVEASDWAGSDREAAMSMLQFKLAAVSALYLLLLVSTLITLVAAAIHGRLWLLLLAPLLALGNPRLGTWSLLPVAALFWWLHLPLIAILVRGLDPAGCINGCPDAATAPGLRIPARKSRRSSYRTPDRHGCDLARCRDRQMRPVRPGRPMINQGRHRPGPADPSPIGSGVSRLAERGRTSDDLRVVARRESLSQTLLLLTGTAAVTAVLTLTTGGPWPALVTLPAVAVVLLLASRAASQAAWAILTLAVGVGIVLGAAPLWVGAAIVVGVLLRRRLTWRIRRSRPRSLARCTPVWALAFAGSSRGVPLRYGLVQLRAGHRDSPRDLFTFVLAQPRRRGDKAVRVSANIGLAALARESADITTGLAHARSAADLLPGRRPRRLAARLSLETGLLLRDAARHAEAVETLKDASGRLWRGRDRKGAVTALAAAASSAMRLDPREGLNLAAEARDHAVRALDVSGLISTELLLAQASIAIGDGALARWAAKSVLDLAGGSVSAYAKADEDVRSAVDERAAAQGNAHLVLARDAAASGHDDEALRHAGEAYRLCLLAGRGYDTAAAELVAADIQERQGRRGTALRHALTAVAHLDRSRYLLPTPRWRADWVRSNEHAYGCALRLAAADHDGRLMAELVEAARLQAVPRPAKAHDATGLGALLLPFPESGEPRPRDTAGADFRGMDEGALKSAAAQAALGTDPLQPSPIVAIDGISLLPHAAATADRLRVDVSEQVTRLAGGRAWWWGAAIADGVYYWAVRGDGRFLCGSTPVAEGTPGLAGAEGPARRHARTGHWPHSRRRLPHPHWTARVGWPGRPAHP